MKTDIPGNSLPETQVLSSFSRDNHLSCVACVECTFYTKMQWLQDNDIKYRYILMKGKADGSSLDLLETKFNRERDNAFIRSLTDSVKGFEYRSRKQAETLERARLLNEQAEQLREKADKLGKP